MTPDAVLGELEGLRALARSLVHGDADADDLLQETAISALAHPPAADRPVRPWLATVLRNRWRMDRRGRSRRMAREVAAPEPTHDATSPDELLDRARTLERLATALVALDEPFRVVIIRRYLDGETAAEIARALGVPAATVRWRLATGLARLRAALDESSPRWQRAFLPFAAQGAVLVKAKTITLSFALLVLLLLGGLAAWFVHLRARPDGARAPATASATAVPSTPARGSASSSATADVNPVLSLKDPSPGQGRAIVVPIDAAGGSLAGRVINWSTGDGVANAELTFTGTSGALTVRSHDDGTFELTPALPGGYTLAAVVAQGFLPFAPELSHSSVRAELVANQAVRGVTIFLFPALPYQGLVVDDGGKPVADARIRLVGTPAGEQVIERIATEWTSDRQGAFTFNGPDGAVFEARKGNRRGFAVLSSDVATTKRMTIKLGDAPARDAAIHGRTVDASGAPIADVLVRAIPDGPPGGDGTRSPAFATSGPDGAFTLADLDRGTYTLATESDDHAPLERAGVAGGSSDVELVLQPGKELAGRVVTSAGEAVPAYTLLVVKRTSLVRRAVIERSIAHPRGEFSVRVPDGDFDLLAMATGWAPSASAHVTAGTRDVRIVVASGATLRGRVTDADTGDPLGYARVMREGTSGGASAQPANAGTVTRLDGTFELTGIPAGPLSIMVAGGDYHPRIEAGLVAVDGGVLGPIEVRLKKLAEGEQPKLELVGIGVKLSADGDTMRVDGVVPSSGAADAGIVAGDIVIAIDGVPVSDLGMEGAVARIRGAAGTTLSVTLRRGDATLVLVVTRKPLHL